MTPCNPCHHYTVYHGQFSPFDHQVDRRVLDSFFWGGGASQCVAVRSIFRRLSHELKWSGLSCRESYSTSNRAPHIASHQLIQKLESGKGSDDSWQGQSQGRGLIDSDQAIARPSPPQDHIMDYLLLGYTTNLLMLDDMMCSTGKGHSERKSATRW